MADLKGDAHAKDGQGNPSNPKGYIIKSKLFGNGNGGKDWDDGYHSVIQQITAITEHGILTGLQVNYVDDGKVIPGDPHGSKERNEPVIFKLNDDEVLQKITGYHGIDNDERKIKSLTFTTNTREFPPVGGHDSSDTFFKIPDSNKLSSEIVGLFGRDDDAYVYAIGAYYVP